MQYRMATKFMCILILNNNFRVIRNKLISVKSENGKDNNKDR